MSLDDPATKARVVLAMFGLAVLDIFFKRNL